MALQSALFAAIAVCAIFGPHWPGDARGWLRVAGIALELTAVAIVVVSRVTLGKAFTPFPRPRADSTLQTTGIYAHARHPIYGGVLLGAVGIALHHSPLVLLPAAALAIVFWLKSVREETWLSERYPGYPAYRAATRRRFIPWIV